MSADPAANPLPTDPASGSVDPAALADLARRTALEAAQLLVEHQGRARSSVETKTSATDMVTEVDRLAERLVATRLLGARPDDGILGEEGTERPGTSGVRWVVDPIDGTTNFLYGFPGFAVSIAAEVHGSVVAGAVADPLHGEVFVAARGLGATLNGEQIRVGAEHRLDHALVATGLSYDATRRRRQAAVLGTVLPLVRDIRRMGAASVDLCYVACGRVDAYFERGLQPWDHAAGALVAAEAGAVVGDLAGGPPSSDFTLAANSALFEQLRELLVRVDAGSA